MENLILEEQNRFCDYRLFIPILHALFILLSQFCGAFVFVSCRAIESRNFVDFCVIKIILANVNNQVKSYGTSSFSITYALRQVFQTLPGYYSKDSYTYTESYNYVCDYVMDNNHLIDEQNQNIIKCKNDRLGATFLVNTFHKCQLKKLITTQFFTEVLHTTPIF